MYFLAANRSWLISLVLPPPTNSLERDYAKGPDSTYLYHVHYPTVNDRGQYSVGSIPDACAAKVGCRAVHSQMLGVKSL